MNAAIINTLAQSPWSAVWDPIAGAPWTEWRGFWLQKVLIGLDPRYPVCFFLPLIPILLLFPRRRLRLGIIITSLVFIAYVFGVTFIPVWFMVCGGFYWLSQRSAVDVVRRRRVWPRPKGVGYFAHVRDLFRRREVWWNPSAIVVLCLIGAYAVMLNLSAQRVPQDWNNWLFFHMPWLFPLGWRPFPWEVFHLAVPADVLQNPPQIMSALFILPQTSGLVIFIIRMMHYFAEISRGTIPAEQRTFRNFLAFNLFAPTLMQGPIERFKDFQDGIEQAPQYRTLGDALYGVYRIGLGLCKNLFWQLYISKPLLDLVAPNGRLDEGYYFHPDKVESYAVLFFCVHAQVFSLYLMFSGYCDVAVGLARLVGYRAAENFRYPWLATSLTDMWRRWHITLSFILRDYIFLPLARRRFSLAISIAFPLVLCAVFMAIMRQFIFITPNPGEWVMLVSAYAIASFVLWYVGFRPFIHERWPLLPNLLLTFALCGVLHNNNPLYVLWGLLMGLMVWINQKWSRWMRTLERDPTRWTARVRKVCLKLHPLPTVAAWALTINAFVLSALPCWGGVHGLGVMWELIRRPAVWLAHAAGLGGP